MVFCNCLHNFDSGQFVLPISRGFERGQPVIFFPLDSFPVPSFPLSKYSQYRILTNPPRVLMAQIANVPGRMHASLPGALYLTTCILGVFQETCQAACVQVGLGANTRLYECDVCHIQAELVKKHVLYPLSFFLVCLLKIDASGNTGNQVLRMELPLKWKETGHLSHCLKESCRIRNTYIILKCEQIIHWDFWVFWYHLD